LSRITTDPSLPDEASQPAQALLHEAYFGSGVLTGGPDFMSVQELAGHFLGIVRFALKYPHTFYVVAALILFLGVTAAVEMPTDIFPEINIPVVSVIF